MINVDSETKKRVRTKVQCYKCVTEISYTKHNLLMLVPP